MLEGIDGSGKTTQAQRLCNYFENKNREVLCLKEPGGTPLGERVRELFLSPDHKLEPLTELLLIEASRHQLVEHLIKPGLTRRAVVVCQRYTYSSLAYQGHGRGLPLQLIEELNERATGGLKPDIAVFLKTPVKDAISRLQSRKSKDRMEQGGMQFLQHVESGYHKLLKDHPEMHEVNGTMAEDLVFQEIIKLISTFEGG